VQGLFLVCLQAMLSGSAGLRGFINCFVHHGRNS
jgi:hypothetical protein